MFETVLQEAKGRIRTVRNQRQAALDDLSAARKDVARLEGLIEGLTKTEEEYLSLLAHFGDENAVEALGTSWSDVVASIREFQAVRV